MASSPLVVNGLLALSTAVFVLGLCIQSRTTRFLVFCVFSAIVYYQFAHTNTGNPPNDYFMASAYTSIWFMASDQLVLTDPHRALRARKQEKRPGDMSLCERLCWAMQLRMNPRGISWNFEAPKHSLAPRPRYRSKLAFVAAQLLYCALDLVILDLASVICKSIPELSADGPPLSSVSMAAWCPVPKYLQSTLPIHAYPCGWLTRVGAVAGYGFSAYAAIGMGHRILSIVSVTIGALLQVPLGGWEDPAEWPHLMGPLREGYTVGAVWGCVWHQMLRRVSICSSVTARRVGNLRALLERLRLISQADSFTQCLTRHAEVLVSLVYPRASTLNGEPSKKSDDVAPEQSAPERNGTRSLARGILKIYAVFFVSGIIHAAGDARILGSWSASRAMPFFLLQATAIIAERGVIHAARTKLGCTDAWYWRALGVLWTFTFLGATLPMWLDPIAAAGVMDEGADFGEVNAWVGRVVGLL
ncbi:hypothetical protein HDZ31DRAFT_32432 [Schizophyllum fasciatum]